MARQPISREEREIQVKKALSKLHLLPCPFCGSAAEGEWWHGGGRNKTRIACGNNEACYIQPAVCGETPLLAARKWNVRA